MWEPHHLTTLWAFTACYRDTFTLVLQIKISIRRPAIERDFCDFPQILQANARQDLKMGQGRSLPVLANSLFTSHPNVQHLTHGQTYWGSVNRNSEYPIHRRSGKSLKLTKKRWTVQSVQLNYSPRSLHTGTPTIIKTCLRNIKIVASANCMLSRPCVSAACTTCLVSA
jgi:hypothetical protein